MVGRALRGPKAGGTKQAFLVSFEDHWRKFAEWDRPFDRLPDLEGIAEVEPSEVPVARVASDLEALPWDVIRSTAARVRHLAIDQKADAFEAIPHGWYVLERDGDGDGEPERLIITAYEHQRLCWEALQDHLYSSTDEELVSYDTDLAWDEFFVDCDDPWPSQRDVGQMLAHRLYGGERAPYLTVPERNEVDPHEVAKTIWDKQLPPKERSDLVKDRYGPLARSIYPSYREYRSAVEDALVELEDPDEATQTRKGTPVFDDSPVMELAPSNGVDLVALMNEVLAEGARLLELESLPHSGEIRWTKRRIKGWFAMAHYEYSTPNGTGKIRVNKVLDSADLSEETLKFLLWHEYLHLYLKIPHPPHFRELERKWPSHKESTRFLYNLNERFDVSFGL